jgi:hypothetical protein
MSLGLVTFHCFAVVVYLFGFWYDINFVEVPMMQFKNDMKLFKGRLKFLTIWNMVSSVFQGRSYRQIPEFFEIWRNFSVRRIGLAFSKKPIASYC